MKYEIKQSVKLEAGQFVKLSTGIVAGKHELQAEQIIRIETVQRNRITFTEFYKISGSPTGEYGLLSHEVCNSLTTQAQFEWFLSSLRYISTPELNEYNIPKKYWPKYHLENYISFLEDQLKDLGQ
jgi:hypothetical protein